MAAQEKAPTVILTGSSTAQDHSEQSEMILRSAGLEDLEILRVPEPMNTKQEIAAIKPLIEAAKWKRVGVISSGWHMRRVMKLAEHVELDLIPAPRRFTGSWINISAQNIIPQAYGVLATQTALKEYLGALVGR